MRAGALCLSTSSRRVVNRNGPRWLVPKVSSKPSLVVPRDPARPAVVACVLAFAAGVAGAQAAAPSPAPRKLIVATHEAPPFIIKNADGSFSGISIDLWRHVADTLRLDYEIRDMAVADLMAAG